MYMVYNIIPLVQLSFKAIGRYINYIYERSIELRSNTKAESRVWYYMIMTHGIPLIGSGLNPLFVRFLMSSYLERLSNLTPWNDRTIERESWGHTQFIFFSFFFWKYLLFHSLFPIASWPSSINPCIFVFL